MRRLRETVGEGREERPRGDDLGALDRGPRGQRAGRRAVEVAEDLGEAAGDQPRLRGRRELARPEREVRVAVGRRAVGQRTVERAAPEPDAEGEERRLGGAREVVRERGGSHASKGAPGRVEAA